MPEMSFRFRLSIDEHRRLLKSVERAGVPLWFILAMDVYILVLVTAQQYHVPRHSLALNVGIVVVYLAMVVGVIVISCRRKLAIEGSLTLSEHGLAGTIDGAPITIRWQDIVRVSDLDDAVLIARRRGLAAIAIPNAAIADRVALWAAFDDKLVSKRGLIRPRIPFRQICNTAFPAGSR